MGDRVPGPVQWCCTDCIMILVNDEERPEWSAQEAAEHRARMREQIGDSVVMPGMLTREHWNAGQFRCSNVNWHTVVNEYGELVPDGTGLDPQLLDGECECECIPFYDSRCATCGSQVAGERHAITFWDLA